MILVIYRVDNTKGYGRYEFYAEEPKDAIRRLYELQKNEGGVRFYNVDSNRAFDSTTRLSNLANFCDDANAEELDINGSWMTLFDLDEKECLTIAEEVYGTV